MQIFRGASSWAQLTKSDVAAVNQAIVTVAGSTTIVTAPDFEVAVGDILLVSYSVTGVQGAVAGMFTLIAANVSGNGAVEFAGASSFAENREPSIPATLIGAFALTQLWVATVAGTITMRLTGQTTGDSFTIDTANAAIHVLTLRGS